MDSRKWSVGIISLAFLFIPSSSSSSSSADELIIQQVTEGKVTEYNSSYNLKTNLGVTRVLRDEKPSSTILTITSFSVVKGRHESFQSAVFESNGYTWTLILFVNGNPNDGGNGYVSLYVRIEETDSLPSGWQVSVDLNLFVYNLKQDKYLTVTDGAVKIFNAGTRILGFGQLIDQATFFDTNQGYTTQDTASFGAEIFIIKPVQTQQEVTFIPNPPDNVFTWKIFNFSTLEDEFYFSDDFLVEDRYWVLAFSPKGSGGGRGNALPIFIYASSFMPSAVETSTWVAVNLRLKNQINSNDKQLYFSRWYPAQTGSGFGFNNIILFSELYDESKGYLVNDSIIFEAEIVQVSVTNIVSA